MCYANGRVTRLAGFHKKLPDMTAQEWEESVLRDAEVLYAQACSDASTRRIHISTVTKEARVTTVLLVGAGIMNLMTAHVLVANGYCVRVIDQGPDPRTCPPSDWARLGITSGGHNARIFTYTEADNYKEQDSEIYQDMQSIFRKTVRNGGWSIISPSI
jgi:hypothetical protein